VAGAFKTRPYTVRVYTHGSQAGDRVPLYLGARLSEPYVRRLAPQFDDEGFAQGCRRFTASRVDCVYGLEGECAQVIAFTLRSTGVIWRRAYDCTDLEHPSRRSPRYSGPAAPVGAPGL
jgi:hypothetical protein